MLSANEAKRYARHIVLKGIGGPGQQKLKGAKVLVVGAGGLGSPLIAYLAAAGVGTLTIVDDDQVSLSNLQRQIVHTTNDIGTNKVQSAARFASELNPEILVNQVCARFDLATGPELVSSHDIVVDGTDRFSSRRQIAEVAEAGQRPLVSGAVSMFDGQVSVFAPHLTNEQGEKYPGFRCLYPVVPDDGDLPACEVLGIVGAVTGVIGTLMAMEVIKLITGIGAPLFGRLLLYDAKAAKFSELKYARRADADLDQRK
ncbi:Molybdopterin-synthase adenylyltransferase [hydrothermal vent metagenome]|uniref:Molybdopterin-synthase adenylyltransferase n=1 Tax=hydrothermal vent metagenome TaxID=652676 RepID=A0A3B0TUV2_9ZZZZ